MNRKKLAAMKAELDRIAKDHGGKLRVEDVVRAARPSGSILHSIFTWDDRKAAHQYRLWQAREFIASVHYEYQVEEHTYRAPEWVRDPRCKSDEQGYISIDDLKSDRALARDALLNEFGRAGAHLNRAHELARTLQFRPSQVETIAKRVKILSESASRLVA